MPSYAYRAYTESGQRREGHVEAEGTSAAEQGGFELADLSVAEPTLETVFINLTGKDLRE